MKNIGSLLLKRLCLANGKLHGQLALVRESRVLKGRSPFAKCKVSYIPLRIDCEKAGFLGAQPLCGVWGVPTLSFPLTGGEPQILGHQERRKKTQG